MTNEEAIKELIAFKDKSWDGMPEEVIDVAIKALEQQPCDDAINRDMALEKMADYAASGYADSAEDFEEYSRIICQLPSVTQKYGKWIAHSNGGIWIKYYECSECGKAHDTHSDYCPNCGAKMQESEDKE